MKLLKILFVGDLIGKPGIALFQKWIPFLKEKHNIDLVIVNGENCAKNGYGITLKIIEVLRASGADVITTGNHVFDNKEVYTSFEERQDIIRPLNYPSECPGKGHTIIHVKEHPVAIVNLHGRVFIRDLMDCPFKAIESLLLFLNHKTKIILVDLHAEATSEKQTMGLFLDGKVSGVFGTHTHVQTADDRILPNGTSYITDLGCCGALNSVIGFQFSEIIKRFTIHHKFGKFNVDAKNEMVFCGAIVQVDPKTGKSSTIERLRIIDNDISSIFETNRQTK
jgi:2',3'-cyclic-nucleotide 2'-phosphodiesterase